MDARSTSTRPPTRRAVSVAVIANPFAGGYRDDLGELTEIGVELGDLLTKRCLAALGIEPSQAESFGKAAIVGEGGELEHAAAILHPKLGTPVRAALGIHSPSTVMMELGAHTAEGFRLGVEGGAGDVAAAMAGLANAPALAGATGGASGGGNIYLTVQVEAHPGTDGAAVGQTAGAAIIRQLADVLGLLNQGPAPAPG